MMLTSSLGYTVLRPHSYILLGAKTRHVDEVPAHVHSYISEVPCVDERVMGGGYIHGLRL
jgi:hypothetical protein